MTHFFIFVGILVFNLATLEIFAMSPEQKALIHKKFEDIGMECIHDHAISENDIIDLKARRVASGDNVPCFLACILKKVGIIDDAGMLQKENALELAKEIFKDNEELQVIHDYLHSCGVVNSEPVEDGEKGCDRAMKAYKCMIENASQFGIDL